MTSPACYPWWHREYAPLLSSKAATTTLSSGCAVNAQGNIPCNPEAMRAKAEQQLHAFGVNLRLSLETYTLARYMQGEVGSGTLEERVAVGEAAVNRAKLWKLPMGVLSLLLFRQPEGHPNRGWYGPIHGVGTGVETAPYGRWATTSKDPTVLTTLLADLVMSGRSDNFSRHADDQAGPEHWIPRGQTALHNYVRRIASEGRYWVGPLPGVDHWHTFLQWTPSKLQRAALGQAGLDALVARGLDALTLPRQKIEWGDLPICGRPASTFGLIATTVLGVTAGVWAFRRFADPV